MNQKDQNKRVLGCIGWAVILSLASSTFGALAAILLNGDVTAGSLIDFFIIYLVPSVIVAIPVGYFTRPSSNFLATALIITPLITFIYSFFIAVSYAIGAGLSDTPSQPTFWNPPLIGISSICIGFALGVIASYGYWHAGRK